MKKFVSRGKVDVFISYENLGKGEPNAEQRAIQRDLQKKYFDCYEQISRGTWVREIDVKTSYIMRSPDVIIKCENAQDHEEAIEALVIKAIDEAVIKLIETREEERQTFTG